MMPTLCDLCRMLSSDIKPLKAGLQEKTQSSLILCVTWHLFGAAFLLQRVWRGIQIGSRWQGSLSQNGYVKKIHWLSYSQHLIYRLFTPALKSILAFRPMQIHICGKTEALVNQPHSHNVHVLESEALM